MGYKDDIKIDIDQLDAEWVKQAGLYQYYARQEAVALYKRDQLADSLSLQQAQLDGDIRLNFKKHGFESKPTEAAILNSIKQNPFYTKANILLMEATCKAKIIGGAVRSFDHKKKALEKLTDLYLSGYWAGPKIKSEAQEVFEKQAREKIEADLKKENRLATQALKGEAGKAIEPKGDAVDQKATVGADKKKKIRKRPKKTAGKKTGGKTKPESRPIGKTKDELLKQEQQRKAASGPKPSGKKKK